MENNSQSLENRLHERISQKGELGFSLVPGAMILDARKDVKEGIMGKGVYATASFCEGVKLLAYSGVAYGLFQLAEKLF